MDLTVVDIDHLVLAVGVVVEHVDHHAYQNIELPVLLDVYEVQGEARVLVAGHDLERVLAVIQVVELVVLVPRAVDYLQAFVVVVRQPVHYLGDADLGGVPVDDQVLVHVAGVVQVGGHQVLAQGVHQAEDLFLLVGVPVRLANEAAD